MSDDESQIVHEAWLLPYKPNAPYKFPRGDKNRGQVTLQCLKKDLVSPDNSVIPGSISLKDLNLPESQHDIWKREMTHKGIRTGKRWNRFEAATRLDPPQDMNMTDSGVGKAGPNLKNVEMKKGLSAPTSDDARISRKEYLKLSQQIAAKDPVLQAKRLREAYKKKRFDVNLMQNLLKFVTDESEIAICFDTLDRNQRVFIDKIVKQINMGYLSEFTRKMLRDDDTTGILMEVIKNNRYTLMTQLEGDFPNKYICVYKVASKPTYLITRFNLYNEEYDFIINDLIIERHFKHFKRRKMDNFLRKMGKDKHFEILEESPGSFVCRIFMNRKRDDSTSNNQIGSCSIPFGTCKINQAKNQVVDTNDSDDEDDVCYMSDEFSKHIIEIDDSDSENENDTKRIKIEEAISKISDKSGLGTSNIKEEPLGVNATETENESKGLDNFRTVKIKSEKNTKMEEEIKKVDENPGIATSSIKSEELTEEMVSNEPTNENNSIIKSDENIKAEQGITDDTEKVAIQACNVKTEQFPSDIDTAELAKEISSINNLKTVIKTEENISTDKDIKNDNQNRAIKTEKPIKMDAPESENENKSMINTFLKTIKRELENSDIGHEEKKLKSENVIENNLFIIDVTPSDQTAEKTCNKNYSRNNLNSCFSDFLRQDAYREFKFLGRFEENEFEVLSEFLEDFFLVKFGNSPLDKDFARIWNDGKCELDYKMDINGGILIYKVS